jgi:hypothetical protein
MFAGFHALPQQPAGTVALSDSDRRDAVEAFEGYNQALIDSDYSKLAAEYIHVPFVIVDDNPRVIESIETVVTGLRSTRQALETAGYATTKLGPPRISVLQVGRLLLNYRVTHVKKDGAPLAERANFYLMVKEGRRWKVGGIILQDPMYFGK